MLDKVLMGTVLVLMGACAYFAYSAHSSASDLAEAQTLTRELKTSLTAATQLRSADTAVGNARAVLSVAASKRKETDNVQLKDAVKATPVWSDQEVPASVVAALRM